MPRIPKSRKSTWLLALITWALCLPFCWQGAPYRLVREWPLTVGRKLIDFMPHEPAILIYQPAIAISGPLSRGRLNRLDLKSGEVREFVASDVSSASTSRLLGDRRWVAIDETNVMWHGLRVFDIKSEKTLDLVDGKEFDFNYPEISVSSSGRFLMLKHDESVVAHYYCRIFEMSGDVPVEITSIPREAFLNVGDVHGIDDDEAGRPTIIVSNYDNEERYFRVLRFDRANLSWEIIKELTSSEFGELMLVNDWQEKPNISCEFASWTYSFSHDDFRHRQPGRSFDLGKAELVLNIEENQLALWVNRKFSRLLLPDIQSRLEYKRNPNDRFVLSTGSTDPQQRASTFSGLFPDTDHPYVVVADTRGVHVWDDPPRKSPSWLASLWLACGLPIFGLAYLRDRSIHMSQAL